MSSQMRVYSGCAKMDVKASLLTCAKYANRHLRLAMMFRSPKTKKSAVKVRKVEKKNHPRQSPPVSSWIQPRKVFTLTILRNFRGTFRRKLFWSHWAGVVGWKSDLRLSAKSPQFPRSSLGRRKSSWDENSWTDSLVVEVTCGIFTFCL